MNNESSRRPVVDAAIYGGEWVALHPETYEIVAHDESQQRAKDTARRQGIERPLLHHVRQSDAYFVGPASRL